MAKKTEKKAKATVHDAAFGELTWVPMDHWVAAVPVKYFQKYGSDMPQFEDEEEDEDAEGGLELDLDLLKNPGGLFALMMESDEMKAMRKRLPRDEREQLERIMDGSREVIESTQDRTYDPDKLFAEGKFKLSVRAPGKKPPTPAQGEAWTRLMRDGERVFDRVMDRVLEVYRRQRPARARWWKAMYDDSPDTLLPDAKTTKALAKVIRPIEFRVHEDGRSIGIHFDCAWDQGDGFGVLLRDGDVVDIGEAPAALEPRRPPTGKTLDHPVFGRLRLASDYRWVGTLHFEPLRAFYNVAEERDALRSSGFAAHEMPRSSPPWEYVDGEFGLEVFVSGAKEPSQAQSDAFAAFMADSQRSADQVLTAILEEYRKSMRREPKPKKGKRSARAAPKADSPDDLRDRITFQSLSVFSPKPRKPPAMGLAFNCWWNPEHGLSVRWRDGKVELIGQADEAAD